MCIYRKIRNIELVQKILGQFIFDSTVTMCHYLYCTIRILSNVTWGKKYRTILQFIILFDTFQYV